MPAPGRVAWGAASHHVEKRPHELGHTARGGKQSEGHPKVGLKAERKQPERDCVTVRRQTRSPLSTLEPPFAATRRSARAGAPDRPVQAPASSARIRCPHDIEGVRAA